jgi:hypothetical protein
MAKSAAMKEIVCISVIKGTATRVQSNKVCISTAASKERVGEGRIVWWEACVVHHVEACS